MWSWCQIFWILNFRHFFTSKCVLHLCFVCKSKDGVSKSILKWEECELLCGHLDIYDCFSLLIILLCIEASSVNLDMRQKYLRTLFNLSLNPKPPQQTFRYIYIYFTRYCQHTLVSVVWNCVFAVWISCSCLVAGVLFEGFLCM